MKSTRIQSWFLSALIAQVMVMPTLTTLVHAESGKSPADGRSAMRPLTAHDIMTDGDAFFSRYLNPDPALSSVEEWPIVKQIVGISGDIIDAGTIADRLNTALPVDEQPAFRHIKEMVDECSKTLGIQPPRLFIQNSADVNAYVTRLKEPHLLVLTSSLYDLYKNRPKELKFIIGHELGHLKCNHLRCHFVGEALVGYAVGSRQPTGIKESLVAPLMVGQLFFWFRESEMSADRAGLICIDGDLRTAQCALLRLLHGTDEEVDPQRVANEQIKFESERFVRILRKLRSLKTTHPFIMDRSLALKQWTTTSAFTALMNRGSGHEDRRRIVIDSIRVKNLPDSDFGFRRATDPIIKAAVGDAEFTSDYFSNNNSPLFEGLQWTSPFSSSMRIIIEVLDHDSVSGNDFVGACHIPIRIESGTGNRTVSLRRDIKSDSTEVNLPEVTVEYHVELDAE